MTIAIVVMVISIISSILGFVFRKTIGALFKLIPIAAVIVVCICFVRGIPVMVKVQEYKKLASENVEELKKDADKYAEYVEKAKEMNDWVMEYKEEILNHPALTFAKDTIESFTELEVDEK